MAYMYFVSQFSQSINPSQSLGLVLKKLNITQQKQSAQEQNRKKTPEINKPKSTVLYELLKCVHITLHKG